MAVSSSTKVVTEKVIPVAQRKDKKPLNMYMLWATKKRAEIMRDKNNFEGQAEISRRLGIEWRSMPEHEREVYRKQSEQLRQEYYKKNPKFKQKPAKKLPRTDVAKEPTEFFLYPCKICRNEALAYVFGCGHCVGQNCSDAYGTNFCRTCGQPIYCIVRLNL